MAWILTHIPSTISPMHYHSKISIHPQVRIAALDISRADNADAADRLEVGPVPASKFFPRGRHEDAVVFEPLPTAAAIDAWMRRQLRPLVQTLGALDELSENARADSSSSDISSVDASSSGPSSSSNIDTARGIFYLGDGDPEDVAPARDGMLALARDLKQNLLMYEVTDPAVAARLGQPIDAPWFAVLNSSVALAEGETGNSSNNDAAISQSLTVFDLRQNHTINTLRQWALVQMLPLLVRRRADLLLCEILVSLFFLISVCPRSRHAPGVHHGGKLPPIL